MENIKDRKLSIREVEQVLEDDGTLHNKHIIYFISNKKNILEEPNIHSEGDGFVTFSKGNKSIERVIGYDTEEEDGKEVFKDIYVIEAPHAPQPGGKRRSRKRRSRKRRSRKSRSRKSRTKSRKYYL
jgi:hypothetical protein